MSKKASSVLNKFGIGTSKKIQLNDSGSPQKWIHSTKDIKDGGVVYHAKYLGSTEVLKPKGVDIVKEAIKKLKVRWQVKKSEAGNKGSKLPRVEINISIDSLKVIDGKTRQMICGRPLHRVSYCADDHNEKKLFAFIAKDQETKKHNCFVFICDKMAAELTMTLGQAFQMAYRRYIEKEKSDIKKNKDMISLEKEIEKMKNENVQLKEKLEQTKSSESEDVTTKAFESARNDNLPPMMFNNSDGDSPPSTPQGIHTLSNPFPPSLLSPREDVSFNVSFEANFSADQPAQESFDPFSNNSTNDSTHHTNFFDKVRTDDLFGDLNGDSVSVFDTSTASVSLQGNNIHSNDFDYDCHGFEEFGSSPHAGDFIPKFDPFADTPDWESVASEEVGSSSVSSAPHNPFSSGSGQLTTNQNVDLFNLANKTANDPFTSQNGQPDPFAAPGGNMFNTGQQQNFDPFNISSEQSLSDATKQNLFPTDSFQGSHTFNSMKADPFSSSTNTSVNANPFSTDEVFQKPQDQFSQYLTKVSERNLNENKVENPFATSGSTSSQLFDDFSTFDTSMQQMNLNDTTTTNQAGNNVANTARPRPSGLCGPGQSIPAPPSKQDVKKTISPVTPTAPSPKIQTKTNVSPVETPTKPHPTTPNIGMLPNVKVLKKAETVDSGLTRTRTRSHNTQIKPLKDSIQNASKSLEDLFELDGPRKDRSQSTNNPFTPPMSTSPPNSPPDQGEFFKEVHSPSKNAKPSFTLKSYSTFEASF